MRFKIRTKLLIAFLAIIFPFIVIVGAIALYNTMTIRNASLKVEAISEELHTVLSLQLAIDKSLMPGNDYIITGDKRYIDEFNDASKDVEDLIEKVEKTLVVLGGMDTPEVKEEMEILKSVKTAWQNIKEASQKIFEIPNPVGNKEAAGLMEEMDYKWAYPAIKMLDKHHEIDRKEHTEAIEELYRAWILAWVIMIGGAVLLITFGVFFAIFYSRLFTRPIETIHNGADAIAKGDFKVRLDIKTGDEIEQLSKAMNEMAKQLDTLYQNMGEKIEEGIKKFSTITESANDAIIVLTSPDTIHFWNKKSEEMFGYKIDEVVGKSVHGLIVPQKFREKAKGGLDNFFKTGQGPVIGKVVEVFGIHKDGREFPIELSVSAVRIGDEWQAIGIIRDITERKRLEEGFKESEERYRGIFEKTPNVMVVFDAETWRFENVNPAAIDLYGYTEAEFLSLTPMDVSAEVEKTKKAVQNGLTEKFAHVPLRYHKKKDGTVFPIEIFMGTFFSKGRKKGFAVIVDMTEAKKAEEAIKESEERFRRLVEYSPHGITVHSEGRLLYINPIGASLLGASDAKELIGRAIMDFLHPDYKEIVSERIRKVLNEGKEASPSEEKFIRLDGSILDAEVSAVSVIYSGKQAVLVHFSDITERKEAEKTLNQRFDELEQFRKVTINRELRMEELKRKNKELEEELKILRGMR